MGEQGQRVLDLVICVSIAPVLAVVLPVALAVAWWDTKSPLFVQPRLGRDCREFNLLKIRTMRKGTPSVGSHEVPSGMISGTGQLLRRLKVDELPQVWNVLKGDMSLVGPRPCLPNQVDVIRARRERDCFRVRPGITGAAQIAKVDMSQPERLAEYDAKMLDELTLWSYLGYLVQTACGRGRGDAASTTCETGRRSVA